jgi:cysteine-rich repeat protein
VSPAFTALVALPALTLLSSCSVLIDARFDEAGAGPLCVGADNASPCVPAGVSGEFICVDDACTSSACGDGFVDARRAEECDDGNTVSGDGCEPFDCVRSCTIDGDCDDGLPCDGVERCVANTCVAGVALTDGASCGADLACRGGVCASVLCGNATVDVPEDCDDGNTLSGDGCENDCTFTCASDDDCAAMDTDVCDGRETCNLGTHRCAPAAPLVCDDGDACTVDSCHPVDGCVTDVRAFDVDGDGYFALACGGDDCDDSVASTNPGAPEICADGVDNDCVGGDGNTPNDYYRDCDGDGYAPGDAPAFSSCMPPGGAPSGCPNGSWTTRAPSATTSDCRDDLEVVAPDAGFAETPIAGAEAATDFDYNCDGREELALPVEGQAPTGCGGLLGACSGASYWAGAAAPACGSRAELNICRAAGLLGCGRTLVTATVACR